MQYITDDKTLLVTKKQLEEYQYLYNNTNASSKNLINKDSYINNLDYKPFRVIVFNIFIELYNQLEFEDADSECIREHMTSYLLEQKTSLSNIISNISLVNDVLYLLCVTFDELIFIHTEQETNTTLLSRIFNQNIGGDLFFDKIDYYIERSQNNEEMLLIAYMAIKFGFRGRYRIKSDSEQKINLILNRIRSNINIEDSEHLIPITVNKNTNITETSNYRLYMYLFLVTITFTVYISLSWSIQNQVNITNQNLKPEKQ